MQAGVGDLEGVSYFLQLLPVTGRHVPNMLERIIEEVLGARMELMPVFAACSRFHLVYALFGGHDLIDHSIEVYGDLKMGFFRKCSDVTVRLEIMVGQSGHNLDVGRCHGYFGGIKAGWVGQDGLAWLDSLASCRLVVGLLRYNCSNEPQPADYKDGLHRLLSSGSRADLEWNSGESLLGGTKRKVRLWRGEDVLGSGVGTAGAGAGSPLSAVDLAVLLVFSVAACDGNRATGVFHFYCPQLLLSWRVK